MSENGVPKIIGTNGSRIQPCRMCQQRKVKCDRKDPCTNCAKAGIECILSAPSKRKKTPALYSDLVIRLKRFEDALGTYGADVDKIAKGETVSRDDLVIRGKESSQMHQGSRERSPYLEKTNGTGLTDQFLDGEEILQSSSDVEALKDPIMSTYDYMFSDVGDRFVIGYHADTVLPLIHPSPVEIFRLWQIFLNRINPLTKVLHTPTLQQKILEASSDLENIPKSFEALMFSIYYFAATSLAPGESESMFGQDFTSLTARYKHGVQQALINASFLKSSEIITLQAFVLYLCASEMNIDPRSLYSLTGLAVRIAQRMGLDRDGSRNKIPPFQIELRRRLWWRIVVLDLHTAEISGGGSPILHQSWDTKLPLNINDSDLYPEMKEPPIETTHGVTEMVFVLIGYEIASFIHTTTTNNTNNANEKLQDLESRLQKSYLNHLNPTLKFHTLTEQMTHSTISRTHMTLHHNRYFPKPSSGVTSPPPTSIETIEFFTHLLTQLVSFNNILTLFCSSPPPIPLPLPSLPQSQHPSTPPIEIVPNSLQRSIYHWYKQKNYPFAAQILLLLFLQTPMFSRPQFPPPHSHRLENSNKKGTWRGEEVNELVYQAWKVLNEGFFWKRMGGSRLGRDSPLNVALAGLTVRAWDLRAGGGEGGEGVEEPAMVTVLRWEREERLRGRKKGEVRGGDCEVHGGIRVDGDSDNGLGLGLGLGFGAEIYESGLFGMTGGQAGVGDETGGFGYWDDLMQDFEM